MSDRDASAAPVGAFTTLAVQSVPATLAARIGAHGGAPAAADLPTESGDSAESALAAGRRYVDAAARVVGDLIASGATSRSSAVDLLAADALATLAFERASEAPAVLPGLAADAMRRFAALATNPGTSSC